MKKVASLDLLHFLPPGILYGGLTILHLHTGSRGPMGIGWVSNGCAAMGDGGCRIKFMEWHCIIAVVSGTNGHKCGWYTGCCYEALVGNVNSRGGVFTLSCNYKLVHHPNGYRLPPSGGVAMGHGWAMQIQRVECSN